MAENDVILDETIPDDQGTEANQLASGPLRVLLATLAFLVPIAVAVIAVFVFAGGDDTDSGSASGVVWSYVVPEGTQARADRGEFVADILPEQLTIAVGDTVTISNEDSVTHTFGPFTVRPGESQKMTFSEPGYFFGVCTVGGHETVTITVV
ncbi:MAG: cupredoxin domain-containing protein [Ilumatobacteraceae bacterium]